MTTDIRPDETTKPRSVQKPFGIALKVISIGVAVAAITCMVFYVYRMRTDIELQIAPRVVATDLETPVVFIDISIKNNGYFSVGTERRGSAEGCTISIIEYNDLSKYDDTPNQWPQLQESRKWRLGDVGGKPNKGVGGVLKTNDNVTQIIAAHQLLPDEGFKLNPGKSFDTSIAVPVKLGKLYLVAVRFVTDSNAPAKMYYRSHAYVYVPKN